MKKIRTVCGDITPDELGTTMIHEHAIIDLSSITLPTRAYFPGVTDEMLALKPENLKFLQTGGWAMSKEVLDISGDDYLDFIIGELVAYKAVGGDSICECSVHGMRGRPIEDLARISKESGVNVVCGTGAYQDPTRPDYLRGMGEDDLKAYFEHDIDEGIDDTGVKPGFVKAAFSGTAEDGGPIQGELDVFRACARICAERDMPMMVHLEVPPMNGDMVVGLANMAISLGTKPERILFCHTQSLVSCPDGTPEMISNVVRSHRSRFSLEHHKRLLSLGINISFDSFGNQSIQPFEIAGTNIICDYASLGAVCELLEQGYVDQVMLGHDFCSKLSGKAMGGYGYTRVPTFVRGMLEQMGFGDEARCMIEQNPAAYLAF